MSDSKILSPPPAGGSETRTQDLDDLIFQGEGWLTSDR